MTAAVIFSTHILFEMETHNAIGSQASLMSCFAVMSQTGVRSCALPLGF